jgi:short-subunit dehydrogenase
MNNGIQKMQTVWLTGASSGIGYELAKVLAGSYRKVLVSARSEQALQQLASEFDNIIAVPFDVSDKTQIPAVRNKIAQHCEQLDCIILNAGVCEYFDIATPDWDMMRRVMDVNYFGAINSLELALPLMKNGAHIVAVSSMATFAAFPRTQAYGASKAALNYFMSALKVDLVSRNIDVTIVNPGFVDTPLTQKNDFPMPFKVNAQQAAEIIVKQMPARPLTINFPKQFSLIIKSANFFPAFWFRFISPKLSRSS